MPSTFEDIARVCHEANRAYCITIGDFSQPAWDDAPDWQKESLRNGVAFHCINPNAGPSDNHDNWVTEKLVAGWTYGPVKDPELKQHPCLVPYSELPAEQQMKDAIFLAIVHAML